MSLHNTAEAAPSEKEWYAHWEAHTQNFGFVGTGFTSQTDLTAVRYSAANSGLPTINRFCLQVGVVEVNGKANVLASILYILYKRT
jgi:hypothetical protein